ncbi:N-formylglutamate amidohydrolase [Burkholderia lata]|uniref:N-formylglutamate amidohydrolase n=1 Tax=Burkholderia lata (strain ATCC 17760 / DSM 23089 / LMG 22485 / NCIMB 9086 / R18194 / 383) TaxID=482957 RepID=UPI0034644E07
MDGIASHARHVRVYMLEPTAAEAAVRIGCIHRPVHQRLETEIDAMVANFGHALLPDLHAFMGPTTFDVCRGNCGHTTTSPQTFQAFAQNVKRVWNRRILAAGGTKRHRTSPCL